jgi:hypothetical protein
VTPAVVTGSGRPKNPLLTWVNTGLGNIKSAITGKQHGTMRKTKHRGIAGVTADFVLNLIAYNLTRIPKLAQL